MEVTMILPAALLSMALIASPTLAQELPLSDPMQPNWYGANAKKERAARALPRLSSIIASNERRLAVINGSVMREGEEKDGVMLRQVLPDRVLVVTADQRLHALRLARPTIGKEPR